MNYKDCLKLLKVPVADRKLIEKRYTAYIHKGQRAIAAYPNAIQDIIDEHVERKESIIKQVQDAGIDPYVKDTKFADTKGGKDEISGRQGKDEGEKATGSNDRLEQGREDTLFVRNRERWQRTIDGILSKEPAGIGGDRASWEEVQLSQTFGESEPFETAHSRLITYGLEIIPSVKLSRNALAVSSRKLIVLGDTPNTDYFAKHELSHILQGNKDPRIDALAKDVNFNSAIYIEQYNDILKTQAKEEYYVERAKRTLGLDKKKLLSKSEHKLISNQVKQDVRDEVVASFLADDDLIGAFNDQSAASKLKEDIVREYESRGEKHEEAVSREGNGILEQRRKDEIPRFGEVRQERDVNKLVASDVNNRGLEQGRSGSLRNQGAIRTQRKIDEEMQKDNVGLYRDNEGGTEGNEGEAQTSETPGKEKVKESRSGSTYADIGPGEEKYGGTAKDQFGPKSQIKMDAEPSTDKIVSTEDIRDHFARAFDIPIRIGKFRHRALGIYKKKAEVVRLKDANDIAIIAHEVAHHIDKVYKAKDIARGTPGARAEVIKLDYEYPEKTRYNEGFSEFVRMWITGEDTAAKAPIFDKLWNEYLEKNKDLKDILKQGAYLIDNFQKQGALERIYSQIDVKGEGIHAPLWDKIKRYGLLTRAYLFDTGAILESTEKKMRGVNRLDPRKINPETSPTMIYRDVMKTATAKARSMVLDGTFDFAGQTTGESLRDVLEPINKDNFKQFISYAYARRAVDLYKRNINPGINKADAEFVVKKYETPVFKQVLEGITEFENRVLDYLVDAGGMSAEVKEVIRALNPIHIPLKRVFEETMELSGQGSKIADMGSPVKKITGSSRKVQNPMTAIIENTAAIISMADKARIGRALIELAEKEPGSGKYIEKIATPMQLTKVSIERIQGELEKAGIDIGEADTSKILSIFTNANRYFGKDNVVSLWRNGKIEFFEVAPELYRSLKSVDKKFLPWYLEWTMGKQAKLVRLGATGLRAGFSLITNPIRDIMTLVLQTEYGKPWQVPYLMLKAVGTKMHPGSGDALLFKRSGVDMSQFLGLDKNSLRRAVDEVLASDTKSKALNIVKHPIEILKELLSVTEALPRLAEFSAAHGEGEKLYGKGSAAARIMGANAASDVTINFRRAGYLGEVLNQIIPFHNVALQGPDKAYRFARDNPVDALLRGVTGLLIPTIMLWWLNKDEEWYKDLPMWQKVMFWNFKTGTQEIKDKDDNTFTVPNIKRLPRPFEWGLAFSAIPEALLNYQYDKDPEALKEAMGRILDQSVPPIFPVTPRTAIEVYTNYDFFRDRPIVPYYMERYKPPQEQYTESTTITAKKLGELLGYSPAKLEHIISTGTGGLGLDLIRGAEGVRGIKQRADIPVFGRLYSREKTPPEKLNSYIYQAGETIQKIKQYEESVADTKSMIFKLDNLYKRIYQVDSPAITEAIRILKDTGLTGQLPPIASDEINYQGVKIPITDAERMDLQRYIGEEYVKLIDPQIPAWNRMNMSVGERIEKMKYRAGKAWEHGILEITKQIKAQDPDRIPIEKAIKKQERDELYQMR